MSSSNPEFCPMVPSELGPLEHAWVQSLRLDGVAVDRCLRCRASRVILQEGLGDALEAIHEAIQRQHVTYWDNGYAYAASLAKDAESRSGTNQEHAQNPIPAAMTPHRTPSLERQLRVAAFVAQRFRELKRK